MGLKEKLKEASKTQFLTEGISPEEISKIVKTAQKRAALLRKELTCLSGEKRPLTKSKGQHSSLSMECLQKTMAKLNRGLKNG